MARLRVVVTLGEMVHDRGAGALDWVDEDYAVSENGLVGVVMVHDERSAAPPAANAAESLAEELGVERVVVALCGENNTEVFDERELMFNPTQHVCSPRFKVLVPREVDEKVARYGELQFFPKMLRTDPVARYCWLKPGDVVECVREWHPGGTDVTWRVVQ